MDGTIIFLSVWPGSACNPQQLKQFFAKYWLSSFSPKLLFCSDSLTSFFLSVIQWQDRERVKRIKMKKLSSWVAIYCSRSQAGSTNCSAWQQCSVHWHIWQCGWYLFVRKGFFPSLLSSSLATDGAARIFFYDFFLPPYSAAAWFESTTVELLRTGIFVGSTEQQPHRSEKLLHARSETVVLWTTYKLSLTQLRAQTTCHTTKGLDCTVGRSWLIAVVLVTLILNSVN